MKMTREKFDKLMEEIKEFNIKRFIISWNYIESKITQLISKRRKGN